VNVTRGERIALILAFLATLVLLGMAGWDDGREPAPTIVKSFEDGSHVWSDGTVSCDPGALCEEER
jgi:hypothetical protein